MARPPRKTGGLAGDPGEDIGDPGGGGRPGRRRPTGQCRRSRSRPARPPCGAPGRRRHSRTAATGTPRRSTWPRARCPGASSVQVRQVTSSARTVTRSPLASESAACSATGPWHQTWYQRVSYSRSPLPLRVGTSAATVKLAHGLPALVVPCRGAQPAGDGDVDAVHGVPPRCVPGGRPPCGGPDRPRPGKDLCRPAFLAPG
jgi:hypothetical protein